MPFTENRGKFFSTAKFAHAATYLGGTVNVILDSAWVDSSGIASFSPVCEGDADDFLNVSQGQQIIINGTTYDIMEHMLSGDGTITIRLHNA